jgi:hypothetical protein
VPVPALVVAAARPPALLARVVIDPDEAAALQRLIGDVRERRLDPALLPDLSSMPGPLASIDEVVMEPLAVDAPIELRPLAALDSL